MNTEFEFKEAEDSLKAMPGDEIEFLDPEQEKSLITSTVQSCRWIGLPKGGKIWGYDLSNGMTVPHSAVSKVFKRKGFKEEPLTEAEVDKLCKLASDKEIIAALAPMPINGYDYLRVMRESEPVKRIEELSRSLNLSIAEKEVWLNIYHYHNSDDKVFLERAQLFIQSELNKIRIQELEQELGLD